MIHFQVPGKAWLGNLGLEIPRMIQTDNFGGQARNWDTHSHGFPRECPNSDDVNTDLLNSDDLPMGPWGESSQFPEQLFSTWLVKWHKVLGPVTERSSTANRTKKVCSIGFVT